VRWKWLVPVLLRHEERVTAGPPVILLSFGRHQVVQYTWGPNRTEIWRKALRTLDTDPPVPTSLLDVAPVYDMTRAEQGLTLVAAPPVVAIPYHRRGLWGSGRSGIVQASATGQVEELR